MCFATLTSNPTHQPAVRVMSKLCGFSDSHTCAPSQHIISPSSCGQLAIPSVPGPPVAVVIAMLARPHASCANELYPSYWQSGLLSGTRFLGTLTLTPSQPSAGQRRHSTNSSHCRTLTVTPRRRQSRSHRPGQWPASVTPVTDRTHGHGGPVGGPSPRL